MKFIVLLILIVYAIPCFAKQDEIPKEARKYAEERYIWIRTPYTRGSGVLLDSEWVVTNYHNFECKPKFYGCTQTNEIQISGKLIKKGLYDVKSMRAFPEADLLFIRVETVVNKKYPIQTIRFGQIRESDKLFTVSQDSYSTEKKLLFSNLGKLLPHWLYEFSVPEHERLFGDIGTSVITEAGFSGGPHCILVNDTCELGGINRAQPQYNSFIGTHSDSGMMSVIISADRVKFYYDRMRNGE